MLTIYSKCGLVCQGFPCRHMLKDISVGIRQNIIKEIKRTEKMSGQWKIEKNTGFLRQLYCVTRLENFGIIQPSNHNREPEKRTRHQPVPDQAPAAG